MRTAILALLVLAVIPACNLESTRSAVGTLEVRAAIDSLWTGYAHASDQRDAAAFGALFTEEASLDYSGAPTARGREAIQAFLTARYGAIDATGFRVVPDETRVSGTLAVQGGTLEESFLLNDKPMTTRGRYALTAEIGSDRAWRITRLTVIADSTVAAP